MTAKEYYKSTRMVETRNWTLEMALNFAEEYAEALRKHAVSGRSEQFISLIKELINVGIIDEDDIEVETWVKNYIKEINCH